MPKHKGKTSPTSSLATQETLSVAPANLPNPVGVLTGKEIKELKLISENIDEEHCLKAASYDLRLGDQIIYCGREGVGKIGHIGGDGANHILLESFEAVLFSTFEKVTLPHNIIGRFDLMIKKGLQGLILQVGPQVEPAYEGPLFGLILNTSGETRSINFKEVFLTIEFSYLSHSMGMATVQEEKIDSLQDFMHLKDINLADLMKPNVISRLRKELQQCKETHGLSDGRKDRSLLKLTTKWTIISAIGTIIFILITIFIADCGGIRTKFSGNASPPSQPFTQQQPESKLPSMEPILPKQEGQAPITPPPSLAPTNKQGKGTKRSSQQ